MSPITFAVALSIGFIASFVSVLSTFIWVPITMPCHEIGHAAAAWLSGVFAVPTFFFTATFSRYSLTFAAVVTGALGVLIVVARRVQRVFLAHFLFAVAAAQFSISYLFSASLQEQIRIAGGLAGEALWAPILIYVSFENFGRWWRTNKIVLAFAATISLGHSLGRWLQIKIGRSELPFGSLLFGEDQGDLNQLVDAYGWSPGQLAILFFGIAVIGLLASLLCLSVRMKPVPEEPNGNPGVP